MVERRVIEVTGVVQGIGFRPFVHRLARSCQLSGYVRNNGRGVVIEVQGEGASLDGFEDRLFRDLPPGGRIDRSDRRPLPPEPAQNEFIIRESESRDRTIVSLAPDRSVCSDCLSELNDPSDRRYQYPFINCTACGPRYTIAMALPYDRPLTTMAEFDMCDSCRAEYSDPSDRRYHAQPIACPACGPRASLVLTDELLASMEIPSPKEIFGPDAIRRSAALLLDGRILAVKGIGGFHLAVDAFNEGAVVRLRELKRRPRKPLAVMAGSLRVARQIVMLDSSTERLLLSPQAPIVLAPKRKGEAVPPLLAPGLGDLGVMLPYSPLHHLLFQQGLALLVMTSGNPPSEPITTDNREAREMLGADAVLSHNRDIHVANDDSVVRTSSLGPLLVRRSRGYVPEAIPVPHLPERPVLALGAELKSTVATLDGGQLVVGRHLGDLDNVRAEEAFAAEVARMLAFARLEPEVVAVDLHPDMASSQYGRERFSGTPIHPVQHHHAHMVAVMVEHGLPVNRMATGIILDGFGLGTDGAVWGGEVLRGGYSRVERVAHLRYVPLPGGDRAAVEPYRMATSYLWDAGFDEGSSDAFDSAVAQVAATQRVSPPTSSAGRLFDGVAALLGVAPRRMDFEGEAAARLEALADEEVTDGYPLPLDGEVLDTRGLIRAVMADSAAGPVRAARFINGLADGLVAAAMREETDVVVLGGGCLVNRLLLMRLVFRLRGSGKEVYFPTRLPSGDGGISAGQAACAACALDEEA